MISIYLCQSDKMQQMSPLTTLLKHRDILTHWEHALADATLRLSIIRILKDTSESVGLKTQV